MPVAIRNWSLDDIAWGDFDPSRVDPELLKLIKAASLVESNGLDYAVYLCNVFPDDQEFQAAARAWAAEEVQHGEALARWARLADPSFDHAVALKRFTEGYRLPLEASESVRGSRWGELVARCIVEVGTSSYYAALGEAAEEPVLKEVCRRIAADELRHYKLFYSHLKRYLKHDKVRTWRRLRVALARIRETEDDELAFAYYAANGDGRPYDRKRCISAYERRAYAHFRAKHVERAVAMTCKAAGISPQGLLARWGSALAYRLLRAKSAKLAAAGA